MQYRVIVIDNGQRFVELDRVSERTPRGHKRKIVKFKTVCPECRGSLKASCTEKSLQRVPKFHPKICKRCKSRKRAAKNIGPDGKLFIDIS